MILIPNIVFVILIALLTAYLTFLTTKGRLTDNRVKGIWNRLTLRGRIVFFVLLGILLVLIFQEVNNTNISNSKEKLLKIERKQRDSIIQERISHATDSISNLYYQNIARAFYKQELKLDTLNKTIVRLRKNTLKINNEQVNPAILLDSKALKLVSKSFNISKYELTIKMRDAGATNFDIACNVLTRYTNDSYSLSTMNFFPKNLKMPKNSEWKTGFTSMYTNDVLDVTSKYLNLVGSYTTLDGQKKYEIDEIYEYKLEDSILSQPMNYYRKQIADIFNKIPNDGKRYKY